MTEGARIWWTDLVMWAGLLLAGSLGALLVPSGNLSPDPGYLPGPAAELWGTLQRPLALAMIGASVVALAATVWSGRTPHPAAERLTLVVGWAQAALIALSRGPGWPVGVLVVFALVVGAIWTLLTRGLGRARHDR